MSKKVMVAGHLCLDIAPKFPEGLMAGIEEIFQPGRLTKVGDVVLGTGGAVSNTGMAMAKLGVDVLLNGKVADDGFGKIIRELVGRERASAFKTVHNENSSYTIVLAPPGIDRIFLHNPATNDTFGADDIDYKAAGKCALFHFGYPPLMRQIYLKDGAELVDMYRRIKELGVTTSLDMGMPDPNSEAGQVNWKLVLEKTLPYVDIFLPSIEEITFMLDRELFDKRKVEAGSDDPVLAYKTDDFTRISDKLMEMGSKIVMLKSGISGCYLRTDSADKVKQIGKAYPGDVEGWANRELWAGSFVPDSFGTATGAGDATIAGFLCGLIRGYSAVKSVQLANTVGAQNVRGMDALSCIDDWETTVRQLEDKNRKRNRLELDGEGWQFNEDLQLFCGPKDGGGE